MTARPCSGRSVAAYGVAMVALVVTLVVSVRSAAADPGLLEDYRLPFAPPPEAWLGGSAS